MSTAHPEVAQVWRQVMRWPVELRQDLLTEINRSLETEARNDGEWNDAKNARRCELIDKEVDGRLTRAEQVELELLQRQATAYRDRVAPPPMEGARQLHQQLRAKKRRGKQA
jgi:hypothetical protein